MNVSKDVIHWYRSILKPLCFILCLISIQVKASEHLIWAFGDTHGDYHALVKLLQANKIIDKDLNWSAGNAKLVSTGDVLDRGPFPRKIFDLLIKLEGQAEEAGGQVLFTLGNHEVLILIGDYRYVAPEEYEEFRQDEGRRLRDKHFEQFSRYIKNQIRRDTNQKNPRIDKKKLRTIFDERFPQGFFARYEAFKPEGYYGKWLLSKSFLNKVDNNLFVHGGLSVELKGLTLEDANRKLKQQLTDYLTLWHEQIEQATLSLEAPFRGRFQYLITDNLESVEKLKEFQNHLLFNPRSPTWYRGSIRCHPYYEQAQTDALLQQFNVDRLFVGHSVTPNKKISTRLNQKVYQLDTGMLSKVYNGSSNLVQINGEAIRAFTDSGNTYIPQHQPYQPIQYPNGVSQQTLLEIFTKATPIKVEKVTTGISEPSRFTFESNQAVVRALFKVIDENPNLERRRRKDPNDAYADRYHHDIAAYRLSELLGIGLVPVSTEREFQNETGVIQYWVENAYSQYEADEKGWQYTGHCDWQAQLNLMNVFDLLIFNFDRNPTNILIDDDRETLIWIDHSRSFSFKRQLNKDINTNIYLTKELRDALKALNRQDLDNALSSLLNRNQISAILKRRNTILNLSQSN